MRIQNPQDNNNLVFNFHNNYHFVFDFELAISSSKAECTDTFICRLRNAYIKSVNDFFKSLNIPVEKTTDWEKRFGMNKADIHSIVYEDQDISKIKNLLSNPYNSELWRGFEMPTRTIRYDSLNESELNKIGWSNFDKLVRLAEAIKAERMWNPENKIHLTTPNADILLKKIEKKMGIELKFPYPYPNMFGLKTYRGILGYRTIPALYCAWLINQYKAKTVLEIGAGLGWAAYHSGKFNVNEYTIVDIPITALASSHFLGLTCGEENITLYDETPKTVNQGKTHYSILPPNAFPENKHFDVVINIDSMTEMSEETAQNYINKIKKCTKRFISINHEANRFTVAGLLENDPCVKNYMRKPFWMRQGYIEEIYEF